MGGRVGVLRRFDIRWAEQAFEKGCLVPLGMAGELVAPSVG